MSNPPPGYPRVSPYLLYEDAAAAVDYLQRTFGFELRLSRTGAAGRSAGAEVTDLETAPAGDRRVTATDPEGQVFTPSEPFAQEPHPN